MELNNRAQPKEWACTRFCRIAVDDESVENFILWLCDHAPEQIDERRAAYEAKEPARYDLVEWQWGWDAPRQRMAKLLWQFLHRGASDEEFRRRFNFCSGAACPDSDALVAPIQERLKWVMEGLVRRNEQDSHLGQGDWGERWWLPPEQSEFVREQLKRTHSALIEQSSDYEDAIRRSLCFHIRHTVHAFAVPSEDPQRVYVGERHGPHGGVLVSVQDTNGNKYPLKHSRDEYFIPDGTLFEWGYGGYGPRALARSILADAFDGDLALADQLEDGFYERFILNYPHECDPPR